MIVRVKVLKGKVVTKIYSVTEYSIVTQYW